MIFTINNNYDKSQAIKFIGNLPADLSFTVNVYKKKDRRSIDQNSLYWLWLSCIADETGNEKDDLHEFFKAKYLPHETRVLFGEDILITPSTTRLNTAEFTEYLERVNVFASVELGISLPMPYERLFEAFYEKYKNYI